MLLHLLFAFLCALPLNKLILLILKYLSQESQIGMFLFNLSASWRSLCFVSFQNAPPILLPLYGNFMANLCNVTEFICLGLLPNQKEQRICFVIFLLLYNYTGEFPHCAHCHNQKKSWFPHVLLLQQSVLHGDLLLLHYSS
jgi:hypothetical protein